LPHSGCIQAFKFFNFIKSPRLSIITVNLNNKDGLRRTVESVVSQTWREFEFILIDGGSEDGSEALLKEYKAAIDYAVSEKDSGIYEAMNKGIIEAKGEYLLFLNSGDRFISDASLQIALSCDFSEDIVYCDVKSNIDGHIRSFPDILRFSDFYYGTINHQCTFIKKKLFETYGYYNEENRIVSDWEFYIKAIFLHQATTRHLPLTLVEFDFSKGISTDPANEDLLNRERAAVLRKYFNGFIEDMEESARLKKNLSFRLEHSLRVNSSIVRTLRSLKNIFTSR
jgi:glycosyltransferase involved in cell wall biosynthesis